MSHAATNWANALDIPAAPKRVLLAIASCHNGKTGQCNPSVARLAELAGLSERSIIRNIRWLVGHKLVTQTACKTDPL